MKEDIPNLDGIYDTIKITPLKSFHFHVILNKVLKMDKKGVVFEHLGR